MRIYILTKDEVEDTQQSSKVIDHNSTLELLDVTGQIADFSAEETIEMVMPGDNVNVRVN